MTQRSSGPWYPIGVSGKSHRRFGCISKMTGRQKVQYDDLAQARDAAKRLGKDKGGDGDFWVAYLCLECQKYHIGRPSRYNTSPRLRHFDRHGLELGRRVEANLWRENNGDRESRIDHIKNLATKAYWKGHGSWPPQT